MQAVAAQGRARRTVRFGAFELDVHAGELWKDGRRVNVQDQPLQVLVALLEKPGQIVTRDELRSRLWPAGTFVDFEHGLNAAVKRLRDGLGDSAERPAFIETVPRRGYRFLASIAMETRTRAWRNRLRALLLVAATALAAIIYVTFR
jgi:DNA-binding winged helix-turn-helix (wHTH) protein